MGTGIDGGIDGGSASGGSIVLANPHATTEAAIRATLVTLVAAITPGLLIRDAFVAHQEEGDFVQWCESASDACFRRFSIRDTGGTDRPEVTNITEELRTVVFAVLVAYPDNFRYGSDAGRNQDDVMVSDRYLLEGAIGLRGYGNLVDASWLRDHYSVSFVKGIGITFIEMRIGYLFTRSTP